MESLSGRGRHREAEITEDAWNQHWLKLSLVKETEENWISWILDFVTQGGESGIEFIRNDKKQINWQQWDRATKWLRWKVVEAGETPWSGVAGELWVVLTNEAVQTITSGLRVQGRWWSWLVWKSTRGRADDQGRTSVHFEHVELEEFKWGWLAVYAGLGRCVVGL